MFYYHQLKFLVSASVYLVVALVASWENGLPSHIVGNFQPVAVHCERWGIEGMFLELTQSLQCEVDTLAYPKAAIFAFSLAVLAYNAVALLRGVLGGIKKFDPKVKHVSTAKILELRKTKKIPKKSTKKAP